MVYGEAVPLLPLLPVQQGHDLGHQPLLGRRRLRRRAASEHLLGHYFGRTFTESELVGTALPLIQVVKVYVFVGFGLPFTVWPTRVPGSYLMLM